MFPTPKTMPSRDLNQLHPVVKAKCELWIAKCKEAGIPVVVTQTWRSPEYQTKLYNQGRTTKGNIVTNCKAGMSPHEYRVAWDFCINIKQKAWDVTLLTKCGRIAESLGITWGGSFKSFVDRPHCEYNGGYTAKQIRLGKMPTK